VRRHDPVRQQHTALSKQLLGHYAYYGITSNYRLISRFYFEVRGIWRKWLSRRSYKGLVNWDRMLATLKRFPLPRPRIVQRFGT
jgi:hypothetical protein